MAVFKYTIANKQGKKLSGTIEATDEKSARSELNSLGFSVLILRETAEPLSPENPEFIKFFFEAIDKNSRIVSGTIPAKSEEEAFLKLKNEYNLTASAIWQQNSTPKQIEDARQKGSGKLQEEIVKKEQMSVDDESEEKQQEAGSRVKINNVLNEVSTLLKTFDKDFNPQQKAEINKKIDKLLRIKNSTNFDYILETANDLVKFIQSQEEEFKKQGHDEERIQLKIQTNQMIQDLNKTKKPSLSETFFKKIERFEKKYQNNKYFRPFLRIIKRFFASPPEVLEIKKKIQAHNTKIIELFKLYFKEPTPEYKQKVKESIKNVWVARKESIKDLKEIKKKFKSQQSEGTEEENLLLSFVEEVNSFSGWLLFFYIIYYFGSLYLNTKDFGLPYVPAGFELYSSTLFKYVFAIIFLLHSVTSLKVNFFRQSLFATAILVPVFVLGSIIILLNF